MCPVSTIQHHADGISTGEQKFIDGPLADNIGLVKSGKMNGPKKESKTFLTIENYVHSKNAIGSTTFTITCRRVSS